MRWHRGHIVSLSVFRFLMFKSPFTHHLQFCVWIPQFQVLHEWLRSSPDLSSCFTALWFQPRPTFPDHGFHLVSTFCLHVNYREFSLRVGEKDRFNEMAGRGCNPKIQAEIWMSRRPGRDHKTKKAVWTGRKHKKGKSTNRSRCSRQGSKWLL